MQAHQALAPFVNLIREHANSWIFVLLHLQTHCMAAQSLALVMWVEKAGAHSQRQVSNMIVNQFIPSMKP